MQIKRMQNIDLTIGEEEIASQKAKIKNMRTGEEIEVDLSEEQWKQDIAK